MPDRSQLPPFAALRAFHAAGSKERFRDAADALGITESAVSHQIRRLEEFLHVQLFERTATGARLTAAGRRYLDAIDPAFRQLQAATDAVLDPTGKKIVRLTLPASLAVLWLGRHLSAFEREYPDIELQLVTTTRVLDLRREQIDLAIRHGDGEWPGVVSARLLDETAFPVCAPGYLANREQEDPDAALSRCRFIVNTRSPGEWEAWGAARGRPVPPPASKIEIEGQEEALIAAERGLGLAIGRRFVVDERLEGGRLVAPFGTGAASGAAFYLCWPDSRELTAKARRVASWLRKLPGTT